MPHRRPLLVAVTAASLVAAVAVGVVVGLDGSEAPHRHGAPTDALAGSPRPSGEGRSGTNPSASTSPSTSPSTSTAPDESGVERLPEAPGTPASGLPGLDPQPSTGPTVRPGALPDWADLPSEAVAARGRIVAGFPVTLLPATPGAGVVTSSVSPSRGRVQVALVARRAQSGSTVLRFYRTRLADAGYAEQPAAAVGGARAASFVRAGSQVLVTVDGGPTYSVWASFRTARG